MKLKRLFQLFVLLTLLFSPLGTNQPVRASNGSVDKLKDIQNEPTVSMTVNPSIMEVGGTAMATVSLNNVPAEGYTSAELNCTYDPNLAEASNIVIANLFGIDPVTAISGPHAGSFVVAIAGSDGKKATSSGIVMAFVIRGLQAGQASLECQARVSQGDNALIGIASSGTSVMILGPTVTPTIVPSSCDKAEFIADINVPPGTVMSPGMQFTKTWRLKNVGSCTWTTSYRVALLSGEQMSAPSSLQFPREVAPGQMVDLSLNMTAPSTVGAYRGYWIFQNSTGGLFGVGPLGNEPWFVDIVVSNATVTPSPTFTVSPSPSGTQPSITPTVSPAPSITPGGPTPTPIPGVVYDFAANMCQAVWFSGAGQLPCPGIDGNPNGFVFRLSNPKLENGIIDTRPGLLTFPQNVQNGYIQGFYPPFHVQNGDRFRSALACEFGATNCYVAFRLDYQVGSDPIKTFFGPFLERYEGLYFSPDLDLSPLAGNDVKFILTVLSAGNATGDRALWVGPVISRAISGPTPTLESPTATSTEAPITFTPLETTMPTSTPDMATGTITGRVLAGKPVTLDLFTQDNGVVTSVAANAHGTFSLTAPAGTYNIVAHASGFLSAMGPITVAGGSTSVKPMINLLAGDIDNNFMIDQLDAMTIGMNYNRPDPSAADLNNDGIINVLDLELLAGNYRNTGPVPWE